MADSVDVGGGESDGARNKRNEKENLTNSALDTDTVAGTQKDGDAQKNKERLRLAREHQKEEQRRKMEELRDAMLRAEDFRKRQEEERRRKIEEMKKREEEHRAIVEERRKKLLDEENERKQAILRRTAERDAKLEQAKSKKACASVLHPLGCGKSSQSDGTLSSAGRSLSHQRPHNMAARPPNYAFDTISSQLRVGRSKEKHSDVADYSVVCSRFRSVSPSKNGRAHSTSSIRRSRADAEKGFDQLAVSTITSTPVTSEMSFKHSSSDKIMLSQTVRRARSVSSRPSKPMASPVSAPVTGQPRGGKVPPSKRIVTRSTKPMTPLDGPTASSSKSMMPSPPKPMTPRALPKELKLMKEVTTSNKPITSNKVKGVHQVSQVQTFDTNEQLSDSTEVKETKELEIIEQLTLGNLAEAVSLEKTDVMKKSVTEVEEYKLKLAENRRLAREKAERDAEAEQLRVEKQREEEEEQIRREEEEERRREEEELHLAEEAVRLEAERFERAVEEEKRRRQGEEDRLEAERKEKLEAEEKVQKEVERKEKERAEKAIREEEERIKRKKRLEIIMKRVKTDETPVKIEAVPSVKSALESPPILGDTLEVMVESSTKLASPAFAAQLEAVDNESSRFRSPILRQMLENKLKPRSAVTPEAPKSVEEDSDPGEKVQENCNVALNIPMPMQDFSSEDTKHIAEPEGETVDIRKEGGTNRDFVFDSRVVLEPNAVRMAADETLLVSFSNGMGDIESNKAEKRDTPGKAHLDLEGLSQGLPRPEISMPRDGHGRDSNNDDEFDALETGEPHEASGLLVSDVGINGTGKLFSGSGASNGDKVIAITASDLLIDLSLLSEEPAAGTSVPVDTEGSVEMGASSSSHLLPGHIAHEDLLTDSTNSETLDELIDLSLPAVLPTDGCLVSVSGQTSTPPNGIPVVAFEDNSVITSQ